MGILSRIFEADIDYDNIKSVTVLETTQLYSNRSNIGYSFGSEKRSGRAITMQSIEPAGSEYSFNIKFKDGSAKIIKAESGTAICDKLLQISNDSKANEKPKEAIVQKDFQNNKNQLPVLGKNQLPNGLYVIGKDIPAGTYDFKWIWGSGSLSRIVKEETDEKSSYYFEYMGIEEKYQTRLCINVKCDAEDQIKIDGNIIVEISKSKPVVIDL
ncbi:MAG: hypothetical protein WC554_13070 [Clostridia bacterium]|jgi:hypothetical protein|nr:hypothetical protein [Clostridia bacterium]MDD4502470.1 hypothetical protein [Clostridia bacterium]NLV34107.1 hypothetical protein [Clostridiaceae bacterium]HQM96384.1 hypothetical protein [Clostridia bacterium]HQO69743.1 hypothetical protein [Clostridia bacterium]